MTKEEDLKFTKELMKNLPSFKTREEALAFWKDDKNFQETYRKYSGDTNAEFNFIFDSGVCHCENPDWVDLFSWDTHPHKLKFVCKSCGAHKYRYTKFAKEYINQNRLTLF